MPRLPVVAVFCRPPSDTTCENLDEKGMICMKITYSVPPKQLKAKKDALLAELARTLPDTAIFVDVKRGLVTLETAPDADPIEIAEQLRFCFASLDLTATRVANILEAEGYVDPAQAPAIQFLKKSRRVW